MVKLTKSYASQKLTIDCEKAGATDWYVQTVDLRQQFLLCKMKFFVMSGPENELLDVHHQIDFLFEQIEFVAKSEKQMTL